MKLRLPQLADHLQQSLASLYFIASTEPVLIQDAVKLIRQAALKQQYTNYQWLSPSSSDEWEQLLTVQQNLDFFSQKSVIELFLPGGKPGQTGAKNIQHLIKNLNQDQIFIITTDKIDKTLLSSRWAAQCEQVGIQIPIWPLNPSELSAWVMQQSELQGVQLSAAVQKELLARTQGNLTATLHALQQLSLYPQPIEMQQLKEIIADVAQYAINDYIQFLFTVKGHALATPHPPRPAGDATSPTRGEVSKSLQLLNHLQRQGVEPTWVIWQLTQYVRNQLNASVNTVPVFKKALYLLYELDAVSKGNPLVEIPWTDPWSALRDFTLKIGQATG